MNIPNGAWVVVCDGRKALIFENRGTPAEIRLEMLEVRAHEDAKTHEQGTDQPGRVRQSVGSARSSVEQTDWHDEAEREFLETLVKRLETSLAAREFEDLVIVAAPRALGVLRAAYSQAVRDALRGEIDKDYVRMPTDEIEKHLAGLGDS